MDELVSDLNKGFLYLPIELEELIEDYFYDTNNTSISLSKTYFNVNGLLFMKKRIIKRYGNEILRMGNIVSNNFTEIGIINKYHKYITECKLEELVRNYLHYECLYYLEYYNKFHNNALELFTTITMKKNYSDQLQEVFNLETIAELFTHNINFEIRSKLTYKINVYILNMVKYFILENGIFDFIDLLFMGFKHEFKYLFDNTKANKNSLSRGDVSDAELTLNDSLKYKLLGPISNLIVVIKNIRITQKPNINFIITTFKTIIKSNKENILTEFRIYPVKCIPHFVPFYIYLLEYNKHDKLPISEWKKFIDYINFLRLTIIHKNKYAHDYDKQVSLIHEILENCGKTNYINKLVSYLDKDAYELLKDYRFIN